MVTLVMDLDHFSMRNLLMPGECHLLNVLGSPVARFNRVMCGVCHLSMPGGCRLVMCMVGAVSQTCKINIFVVYLDFRTL